MGKERTMIYLPRDYLLKRVVLIESISFLLIIVVLWLDEMVDLPHVLFRSKATPFNLTESLFETAIVFVIGLGIILLTKKLLTGILNSDQLIVVCSYCKKIKYQGEWIEFDEFIKKNSEINLSHGLCSECYAKYYKNKK